MTIREPQSGVSVEQVRQIVEGIDGQLVINRPVAEGETVTLPDTDRMITLNLETGGQALDSVNVVLPGNPDGVVGQRIFVNADGQIANAHFESSSPSVSVNGGDYMFNPGDNCVFYRNKPNQISRITA